MLLHKPPASIGGGLLTVAFLLCIFCDIPEIGYQLASYASVFEFILGLIQRKGSRTDFFLFPAEDAWTASPAVASRVSLGG